MGCYINLGNRGFASSRNGEYVDKSGLIAEVNKTLFSERQFSCVSRCRRFGKSMAAKMLCAYYDKSCDSRELFRGLQAEQHPDFQKHLNKYPVIYLDMTTFITEHGHDNKIVEHIQTEVAKSVMKAYPDVDFSDTGHLMSVLHNVVDATGDSFIMIIDEWDAICREFTPNEKAMDEYVNLLRRMFKSVDAMNVFAGVYMTGILPIKRYKTESALNNFWEYSMVQPRRWASYFGFTRDEVKALCAKYGMDFEDMAKWYDGYSIGDEPSMFNPSSVMKALDDGKCRSYWAATGSFEAVKRYIQLDYEGLKRDLLLMLGGGQCRVKTTGFLNDPNLIQSKDDVLTILIHLGYLSYDEDSGKCFIPNKEVAGEMECAIEANDWHEVIDALNASDDLLASLLEGDSDAVAAAIRKVHEDNASILKYNDENSLACVLGLALYSARNKYKILREMPTGKGFADLVLIPWRNVSLPAIVVELKWRRDATTAIDQIRERNYPASLKEYAGEILLCGVSYDPTTKHHQCRIEAYTSR